MSYDNHVIVASILSVNEVEDSRAQTKEELKKPDPKDVRAFDQILGVSTVFPPKNQVKGLS